MSDGEGQKFALPSLKNYPIMSFMTDTPLKKERPLSPHLQIYKLGITGNTSILHRVAGVALTIGLILLTWGLVALSSGREAYEFFITFCTSPVGQILLAGWTAAFYYHMCTGIRHLVRDCGLLFENRDSCITGWLVIVMAVILTALTWAYIYQDVLRGVLS